MLHLPTLMVSRWTVTEIFLFSDLERNNIRKISTTGVVSTFAGDPNGNPGSADGSGIAARFNQPLGIVIDKSDNVYVADNSNYKVRKITPGGIVTTLAGNGTSNFADGTGTAAGFSSLVGICLDLNGNLMVCDNGVHRIRKITQTGVVTTFAGDGTSGAKDGPALSASFNFPVGIVADQSGNFYVTDQANANDSYDLFRWKCIHIGGEWKIDNNRRSGLFCLL